MLHSIRNAQFYMRDKMFIEDLKGESKDLRHDGIVHHRDIEIDLIILEESQLKRIVMHLKAGEGACNKSSNGSRENSKVFSRPIEILRDPLLWVYMDLLRDPISREEHDVVVPSTKESVLIEEKQESEHKHKHKDHEEHEYRVDPG
ncbi:hypothetical protein BGZ65_002848 [Modicella reniformis]|uniref:Uncharacterized protein n=1 Tax=Modicella reniformis TaxID=1440133 RepID=A0A9P6MIY0_9FUNG|nr:hypothetical protein BGZ65_002848 [Modicella reniformis]